MPASLKHLAMAGVVLATLSACGGSNDSNGFIPFLPPPAPSPAPPAPPPAPATPGSVEVKLIAFNDLHGNLEPPRLSITAPTNGAAGIVPAALEMMDRLIIEAVEAAFRIGLPLIVVLPLLLGAFNARTADEGRSPFSKPGLLNRLDTPPLRYGCRIGTRRFMIFT